MLSPIDGSFILGGRVADYRGSEVSIADAFGVLRLTVSPNLPIHPGDLVVFRVEKDERGLSGRELVEHRRCPEPTSAGEFLRLQNGGRGRILRARNRATQTIRKYFLEQNFVEVDTPSFALSPGLDAHVHSLAEIVRPSRRDYLITSPEFHMKRLLAAGMPRIFQMARCFRRDEQGPHHEPEFTLVEWYRAFAQFEDVLGDTEELVARVFAALEADAAPERPFIERPFFRYTIREAYQACQIEEDPVELSSSAPDLYFRLFLEKIEPWLLTLGRPTFLTHYPISQAALARESPEDPSVAERFELYVGGIELSNGYGELTDASLQRERFLVEQERRRCASEEVYPLDERFLHALEEGLPPCSGNALGLDRLVALALGASTLQQVLPFSDQER